MLVYFNARFQRSLPGWAVCKDLKRNGRSILLSSISLLLFIYKCSYLKLSCGIALFHYEHCYIPIIL